MVVSRGVWLKKGDRRVLVTDLVQVVAFQNEGWCVVEDSAEGSAEEVPVKVKAKAKK